MSTLLVNQCTNFAAFGTSPAFLYSICSPSDKATNSELSEPDWEVILDIVEEIKQKNVS